MGRKTGLAAAVLAYSCWGLLAPLAKILLESFGPFTLNALRTAGSLVALVLLFGPAATRRTIVALARDVRLWILGVVGLGLTLGAYIVAIKFLPPTIAALTSFVSPVLVAWGARWFGERPSILFWPTVLLTGVGGTIAVLEPGRGIELTQRFGWGIALGLLGMLGWTFYTLYIKALGKHYADSDLTLAAFITSGVAFFAIAIPFEGLRVEATPTEWGVFAFYVLVPSVASFALYSYAIRRVGATLVSVLLGIEVVATAVFSYFLTHERFSATKLVGIGIVLVAVTVFLAYEALRAMRRPAAGPTPE